MRKIAQFETRKGNENMVCVMEVAENYLQIVLENIGYRGLCYTQNSI